VKAEAAHCLFLSFLSFLSRFDYEKAREYFVLPMPQGHMLPVSRAHSTSFASCRSPVYSVKKISLRRSSPEGNGIRAARERYASRRRCIPGIGRKRNIVARRKYVPSPSRGSARLQRQKVSRTAGAVRAFAVRHATEGGGRAPVTM